MEDIESSPPKKLLILDLNGLICRKDRDHTTEDKSQMGPHRDYYQFRVYRVLKRPHVDEFLTRVLNSECAIAIWTSTTEYNGRRMIEWMFPEAIRNRLRFIWYRDRTRLDPDYGQNEAIAEYDTVKNLQDVWSHPYINGRRHFGPHNTCIVDDSQQKMRFNSPDNVILVSDVNYHDDNWVQITLDEIQERFTILDMANAMTAMEL